jgi:hypothetical protein
VRWVAAGRAAAKTLRAWKCNAVVGVFAGVVRLNPTPCGSDYEVVYLAVAEQQEGFEAKSKHQKKQAASNILGTKRGYRSYKEDRSRQQLPLFVASCQRK